MTGETRPALRALALGDEPAAWDALGFTVEPEGICRIGGVALVLRGGGGGIHGWAVDGVQSAAVDGLVEIGDASPGGDPGSPASHPCGAVGIDHVVVTTPAFDRTAAALEAVGMPLRRIREVGGGPEAGAFRQGFRRLGPAILELVELTGAAARPADGPARFWGLVVIVTDLDALAARLGALLQPIRPAVQLGRRIAPLRADAGLREAVAFMDPEP